MKTVITDQVELIKCLVVDDLEENLLALSALLRADGVEVLTARSGPEALELLLRHEFALALLDVQMPGMDGFELAELMRGSERTKRVPIIFVTAGARDQQRMFKGYDSGAVDFLFKPVEPHVLKSKADVFFRLQRQTTQLAAQLAERTETLRLYETFTGVLGHDLRSPLTAILLAANVLTKSDDKRVSKAGSGLVRSSRWMSRMIEDMLDLTRARIGGGIVIQRGPVDLSGLVERVVQERSVEFPGRVQLRRRGRVAGEWDADRLIQVTSNLVGNALVHGESGAPVLVEVNGENNGHVILRVVNKGCIPEEIIPRIFDPFRSGRRHPHRSEGLGLGLYIVDQIVQAHRGCLSVAQVGGDSTEFRVLLPRHAADAQRPFDGARGLK